MPSVAALEPAWTAGVECCLSERLPANSFLLTSGLDFSDVAPAFGDPLLSMNELVLALLGIPSIKDIIGDTVGLHRFFSDSQPLVDALLGVGTCQEWLRLSSKQRLIERYKELRNAREPVDQKLMEFCRLYLASKHACDVHEELRKATEATSKQQADEDRRHEQERQARELAADAMRQSQAMDDMIRAAEAGYNNRPAVPVVRSDLEW